MKKLNKKTVVIICAAAGALLIALLAAAVIWDIALARNERGVAAHTINYYECGGSTFFTYDAALLENSLAGSVDAFLTVDGSTAIARAGTGLYRISESGIIMIHPSGVDRALLSMDSRYIVYTTATQLHIYDNQTGEVTDVSPDNSVSIPSIVISPDGQTVGYTVKASDGSFGMYTCSSTGKNITLRSRDAYAVGVGDNADFWYYTQVSSGDFYRSTDKRDKKLGASAANIFEFNRDLTEVTFDMNDVTYYSVDGKSAKTLVAGASVFSTAGSCKSTQGGSDRMSYVRDCDSLFGGIFYSFTQASSDDSSARDTYDIWYVARSCACTSLAVGAYQFSVSEDNARALCLIDDELYVLDIDSPKTAKLLQSDVYMYCNSVDFSNIYCIGRDAGLYLIKNLGSAYGIMSNAAYCITTDDGKCLVLTNYSVTGDLYCIDGDKGSTPCGSSVYYIQTAPGVCYFYTAPYSDDNGNNVYDLYISPDGTGFKLALKGIKLYSE